MTREVPKKPLPELVTILNEANKMFQYGTRVRHHSGDEYIIRGQSIDCKTNVLMMIYTKYDPTTFDEVQFTRPFDDFVEPRFTIVRERNVWLTDEEYRQLKGENNK